MAQLKVTEKRVIEALVEVKSRLDEQDKILKALAERSDKQGHTRKIPGTHPPS